jgi:hypothetical protein
MNGSRRLQPAQTSLLLQHITPVQMSENGFSF